MVIIAVAPLAGAWIEISTNPSPLRNLVVAPLAGAWIEIHIYILHNVRIDNVTHLAGAWIEIQSPCLMRYKIASLPLRERGLK